MTNLTWRTWVRASRAWSTSARSVAKLTDFCAGNFYGLQQRIFDLLLGVSTRGIIASTGDGMFYAGGYNCPYQDCQWLSVRRALKDLDPGTSDVFVDLGSGKGKALLIAGQLPYRRVVGVEMNKELSCCAEQNINRARSRLRAGEVECLTANVLEWSIPDDSSVIFMFNPFVGQTFSTVVSRIIESYDRNPRSLHIIYEHPWEHDKLLRTGRVVVDSVRSSTSPPRRGWWQGGDVIVSYEVVGSATQGQLEQRKYHRASRPSRAFRRWSVPNGHNFDMSIPRSDELCT